MTGLMRASFDFVSSNFLKLAFALIGLSFGSPGLAQDQSKLVNIPADKFVVAPGGVDLRTGRYAYNETDLLIGEKGQGGLSLVRTMPDYAHGHANPFGNFSHNWDIWLVETKVTISEGLESGDDYRMFLHIGGRTLTFESYKNSVGFAAKTDGPAMFLTYTGTREGTPTYTFTDADGTIIKFRTMGTAAQSDCAQGEWNRIQRRCVFASEIIRTDGTKLALDYAQGVNSPGNRARLRQVTSSRGYALLLEGSGTHVSKACLLNLAQTEITSGSSCPSSALATTEYSYDPFKGVLTSMKDAAGGVSSFTYEPIQGGTIMGFVKPGQTLPWLKNWIELREDEEGTPQEIVNKQVFADGQSYVYGYGYSPVTANKPTPTIAGGSYTDAAGKTVSVVYDFPILHGTGPGSIKCPPYPCTEEMPDDGFYAVYQQTPGPITVTDELNRTTSYDYCDPAVMAGLPPAEPHRCVPIPLQSFTDPEGIKTLLEYDGNRNITKATRVPKAIAGQPTPPSEVITAEYGCTAAPCLTKPTRKRDARANVTDYTYDPVHGGVLTETGPAVNGVRPQKRYGYAQRYAWIKNASGGYSQAASPIWLLVRESSCKSGAASATGCAIAGDEVVTDYDYGPDAGPNTLLLRGKVVTADGGSLRTCYGYDGLGNRISETEPRAGLTSCP